MAAPAGGAKLSRPRLSVVVAAQAARGSVEDCLSALTAQGGGEAIEVLVVGNCADGTADMVRQRFPALRLITVPGCALVPELWEAGLREAAGDIVALSTAHCVVEEGWAAAILDAHRLPVAGVGGVIRCHPSARPLDWAVYLCRYSAYMPPGRGGVVAELAGDNASYKRTALERCWRPRGEGFWEPEVHAAMRKAGLELWLAPAVVVTFRDGFGFAAFARQRFRHGMRFGRDRSVRLPPWKVAMLLFLTPAIPPLLLARIARRVLIGGKHVGALLRALPCLVGFVTAWAAGEALGYLRGRAG